MIVLQPVKKGIFQNPPQKRTVTLASLKQTARMSLDYLLSDCSPILCDITTPNEPNPQQYRL